MKGEYPKSVPLDSARDYLGWVGSHTSEAKAKSSRANGKLGGRPKGSRDLKPRSKNTARKALITR